MTTTDHPRADVDVDGCTRPVSTTRVLPPGAKDTHDGELQLHAADSHQRRERGWSKPRARRVYRSQRLAIEVAALEKVVVALQLVRDADEIWDEYIDDDTKRVRGLLRGLAPLPQEINRLRSERILLQRLVAEHRLAQRTHRELLEHLKQKQYSWETQTTKWRALIQRHFQPLTMETCTEMTTKALQEIQRFTWSKDKQTTGLSYMGWRDSRRLIPSTGSIQFCFEKVCRGYDFDHHVQIVWRAYTEPQLYTNIILGGKAKSSLTILQQLTPQICVVQYSDQYLLHHHGTPGATPTIHTLYLVVQVDADDGVVYQFAKSIDSHDIHSVMNSPTDVWTNNFLWLRWSRPQVTTTNEYRVEYGGTIYGDDPAYVNLWLFEVLGTLLRVEAAVKGTPLLEFA